MEIPSLSPQSQWAIIAGSVILAGAFLTGLSKIVTGIKIVVAPLRELMSEHNVLWEDYNIRTGGSYRRTTGRGTPPDPEEFYRSHPLDRK
jgi:hypothetical protein